MRDQDAKGACVDRVHNPKECPPACKPIGPGLLGGPCVLCQFRCSHARAGRLCPQCKDWCQRRCSDVHAGGACHRCKAFCLNKQCLLLCEKGTGGSQCKDRLSPEGFCEPFRKNLTPGVYPPKAV